MKVLFSIILLSLTVLSFSQSLDDALRYSQSNLSGTAKYVSMGGAFGALGGDISAISDNPAAIGVFMYSEFNASTSIYNVHTDTRYLGENSFDNKTSLHLDNMGFVGVAKLKHKDWKVINYGFSYRKRNNYNQNIYAQGVNNNNSITDYFADQARGTSLYDLDNNYDNSYLGDNAYQTYLIDPLVDNPDNTNYKTAYSNYGELQINKIKNTGQKSDYSFSVGTNFRDMVYLGMSLNYSDVKYTHISEFKEQDQSKIIDDFKSMEYNDKYETRGFAYGVKLGIVVKPVKWLRMAYSYHSPITYRLTDDYNHIIQSWGVVDKGSVFNPTAQSSYGVYEYKIYTPAKMMAALGFVIGKVATLGLEYEYLDYASASIKSYTTGNEFSRENSLIKQSLKAGHNAKLGFEYRLGQISLRTGLSYFDTPYRPGELNKDAYTIYYNGGIGLNFGYFYADVAYSHGQSTSYYFPYQVEGGDVEPYKIMKQSNSYIATVGVRF